MSHIKTAEFTPADWGAFAGATGNPRIAEIQEPNGDLMVAITDDTGLSVHCYTTDINGDSDYTGWYHLHTTQKKAEWLLSKTAETDLAPLMDAVAHWESC